MASPSVTTPAPRRRAAPSSRGRNLGNRVSPTILFATVPSIVWYLVFTIGPLIGVFVIAFLDWRGLIYTPKFAGIGNFERVFSDPLFFNALRNSIIQVAITVPLMIPLAFMLGYFLNTRPRGHRVLNVFFFTPGLISISVKGTIFYGVLAPRGGLNAILNAFGLDKLQTAWLSDPATALGAIIAIELWSGVGWTAVLFAARISSLPPEIFEAADLDGAGQIRKMWGIAFPMTKEYFTTLAMLQFLWTLFSSAALIIILTSGGPGTSTTTLAFLVFQKAFSQQDLGYSQVVGIVLIMIGILGMLVIRRGLRSAK
ncbi:sugar ABC transporter permease [soil metagenome]